MKTNIVVALDVGGTFVKGCVLENGSILPDTMSQFDARSHESKDVILDHFINIILDLMERYHSTETIKTLSIGFAFPGPFDYDNGVSYIRELDKFESLYGVNVYDELLQRLRNNKITLGMRDIAIRFENDGRLFGLGASTLFPKERLICLTLGTGLGSSFIDHGRIVKQGEHVPPEGYLYPLPFQDGIADDRFSRRGILRSAEAVHLLGDGRDVKEIADLARNCNVAALGVFQQFGVDLADMLLPYIRQYQADRVVIGGQIAKSFDLFQSSMEQRLSGDAVKLSSLDNALQYTFIGIDRLFAI